MSLLEGLMACQLHMNSLQNPWVLKRRLLTLLILLYEHINMKALKRDPILKIVKKILPELIILFTPSYLFGHMRLFTYITKYMMTHGTAVCFWILQIFLETAMVEYMYAYMFTHLCLIRVTPIIFRSGMHSIYVNCGKNISLLLLFLCVFIQINATQDVLCGFAFIIPIILVYLFTSRFHALREVVPTTI